MYNNNNIPFGPTPHNIVVNLDDPKQDSTENYAEYAAAMRALGETRTMITADVRAMMRAQALKLRNQARSTTAAQTAAAHTAAAHTAAAAAAAAAASAAAAAAAAVPIGSPGGGGGAGGNAGVTQNNNTNNVPATTSTTGTLSRPFLQH